MSHDCFTSLIYSFTAIQVTHCLLYSVTLFLVWLYHWHWPLRTIPLQVLYTLSLLWLILSRYSRWIQPVVSIEAGILVSRTAVISYLKYGNFKQEKFFLPHFCGPEISTLFFGSKEPRHVLSSHSCFTHLCLLQIPSASFFEVYMWFY